MNVPNPSSANIVADATVYKPQRRRVAMPRVLCMKNILNLLHLARTNANDAAILNLKPDGFIIVQRARQAFFDDCAEVHFALRVAVERDDVCGLHLLLRFHVSSIARFPYPGTCRVIFIFLDTGCFSMLAIVLLQSVTI